MNPNELRNKIAKSEEDLTRQKSQLAEMERNCRHNWGPVTPDHIYHKGYTSPGDPPGTMGVDWRGPVDVPARTEYRWKRVCSVCGKVQYTSRTQDKVEKVPIF